MRLGRVGSAADQNRSAPIVGSLQGPSRPSTGATGAGNHWTIPLGRRFLPSPQGCKHNVSMPHILVRDVPDDVHAALQRKAEGRHQSLQQYLAVELRHLAERRAISDVLDEVEVEQGGRVGFVTAAADLDEERPQR